MTSKASVSYGPMWMVGVGLIAAWWIPYLPLPFFSFYKEWVFATSVGFALLLIKPEDATLPRQLSTHPLVLASVAIAAVTLLEAFLKPSLASRSALYGGYIFFFLACGVLGRALWLDNGRASLRWLSWILVISAFGSCFFGALQLNWISSSIPLVVERSLERLTANVAQANHFADLLGLGCVALAVLFAEGRLTLRTLVPAAVVFQTFALLSGSRMIWLFAVFLGAIGAMCLLRGRSAELRRFGQALLVVAGSPVFLAMVFGVLALPEFFGISTSVDRAASSTGTSDSLRSWRWHAALQAIQAHPLAGVGIGRYVGHAFQLGVDSPSGPANAADSNAHNFFLHMAAEMGLPIAIATLCALVWWFYKLTRHAVTLESLAVLCMSALIWIHALLEYPLAYAYFLGLFGLLVGMESIFGARAGEPVRKAASSYPTRIAATLVLVACGVSYWHVLQLERVMQRVVLQNAFGAAPQADAALLNELSKVPAWSPYQEFSEAIFLMTAMPKKEEAAGLSDRCRQAISFAPSSFLVARCTVIHHLAHRDDDANELARAFCKIYPDRVDVLVASLNFAGERMEKARDVKASCIAS